MEFIDSSHINGFCSSGGFRFHLVLRFLRFARRSPRDRSVGQSFCFAGSSCPLLLPAPRPRENPVRHEGLKTMDLYRGHACFPKSEPINGADLTWIELRLNDTNRLNHTTHTSDEKNTRYIYRDECEIKKGRNIYRIRLSDKRDRRVLS